MSGLFRWHLIILLIVGIPVGVYFLASNFLVSTVGGSVGLVFGILYCLLVVFLLSRSPMWPRSGAGVWWVLSSLVWGAGVSFLVVMVTALAVSDLVMKLGWDSVEASFAGAYPEEIGKALGVMMILFAFRGLNRPWHGLMTGALVGLGFEAIENALYGSMGALMDANSDLEGVLYLWGLRVSFGPALHIVLSALAGWGIGLAMFSAGRSWLWRFGQVAGWGFVAFGLHFLWNYTWPVSWGYWGYIAVSLVLYPLVIWVWVRAHREARAVETREPYVFSASPQRRLAGVPAEHMMVRPLGPAEAEGPRVLQ